MAFNGRCTADVLNSFIIDEVKTAFDGVKDSSFITGNNTTYHRLNGCVLWYKQLGEDGLPSNYPTLSANQMLQGQFDFMPAELLVVVGFQLDAIKRKLPRIEIIRFGPGRRIEFVIEVLQVAGPQVMPMPTAPAVPRPRRVKVALKNGFEQKAFGSGSE